MSNSENDGSPGQAMNETWLESLSAWVDGELTGATFEEMNERLASDPAAAARAAHYRAQKSALQALFEHKPESAPHYLVVRPRRSWPRVAGIAACWVMVGAVGSLSAANWLRPRVLGYSGFAERASIAYSVYAPDLRHPVEIEADHRDDLARWLSKRLDRPLTIPSLRKSGFTLIGGRLLPGEQGPAAQLMYQNDAGDRLALYMTPVPKNLYKIRVLNQGSRRTFYWADKHIGYALSGQLPAAQLRHISYRACVELGGDPARW